MKTTKIKSGTKEEITKYMRSKVKRMIMDVTKSENWLTCKKNEFCELESNPIEQQIDSFIQSGSPIVVVSLAGRSGGNRNGYGGVGCYKQQFLLTNFGDLKIDMELEKSDNLDLRDKYLNQIKMLIEMEMDAEERWNKILKVIENYKGISIAFEDAWLACIFD